MHPFPSPPLYSLQGLVAFAKWLFEQCTVPRARARLCATDLFDDLCPLLPKGGGGGGGRGSGGSKAWVLSEYGARLGELPICSRFDTAHGLGSWGDLHRRIPKADASCAEATYWLEEVRKRLT